MKIHFALRVFRTALRKMFGLAVCAALWLSLMGFADFLWEWAAEDFEGHEVKYAAENAWEKWGWRVVFWSLFLWGAAAFVYTFLFDRDRDRRAVREAESIIRRHEKSRPN